MTENSAQTNTAEKPKVVAMAIRDAKGRLMAGSALNPGGKPRTGYQDGRTRFNWLSENYTVEEIDAMVMNKKKRRKLLYRDAVLLEEMSISVLKAGKQAAARGYSTEEIARARRFCIEQIIGKAAITLRHGGAPEHGPIETTLVPVTPEQALAAFRQAQEMAITTQDSAPVTDAEFTDITNENPLTPDEE